MRLRATLTPGGGAGSPVGNPARRVGERIRPRTCGIRHGGPQRAPPGARWLPLATAPKGSHCPGLGEPNHPGSEPSVPPLGTRNCGTTRSRPSIHTSWTSDCRSALLAGRHPLASASAIWSCPARLPAGVRRRSTWCRSACAQEVLAATKHQGINEGDVQTQGVALYPHMNDAGPSGRDRRGPVLKVCSPAGVRSPAVAAAVSEAAGDSVRLGRFHLSTADSQAARNDAAGRAVAGRVGPSLEDRTSGRGRRPEAAGRPAVGRQPAGGVVEDVPAARFRRRCPCASNSVKFQFRRGLAHAHWYQYN